jgi:hypothetical protein
VIYSPPILIKKAMEQIRKFKVFWNNQSVDIKNNIYTLVRETKCYYFLKKDGCEFTKGILRIDKRSHSTKRIENGYHFDVPKINTLQELN